jgi:tetratricopeptide (TPR) repeat protein
MEQLLLAITLDRRRNRRSAAIVTAIAVTAVLSFTAGVVLRGESTTQRDQVEELTIEARAAAARTVFVYPPADQPEARTAYTAVSELEDMGTRSATRRATELRSEFADTLVRLGDRYWNVEGARPFAYDYYAQALVFEGGHAAALAKNLLSPGELAHLRAKAEQLDFERAELEAAAPLLALAKEDPETSEEWLAAIPPVLPVARHQIERQRFRQGEPEVESLPEPAVELPIMEPPLAPTTSEDVEAADELAAQANKAFRRSQLDAAERLYQQALELDPENADVLEGLADLAFERGRYREVVRYGKALVRARPNKGRYRILLGDGYFRTLNYAAARKQYERARALGEDAATDRLARIAQKTGK